MKNAAHAAWRRARSDNTEVERAFERGFAQGYRASEAETGPIAYSVGHADGWAAHKAKAEKKAARRDAAERDGIYADGYKDGLRDNSFVVRRLKQRLAELEQ